MITLALAALGEPGQPESEEAQRTWEHLARYCCYDKRKRQNFFDQSNA